MKLYPNPPADGEVAAWRNPGRFYRPAAKQQRIEFLERHKEAIKAHMRTRMEDGDHHGVSDDANDLREVEAELRGLRHA